MYSVFSIYQRIWFQRPKLTFDEGTEWVRRVDSLEDVPDGAPVGLFYPAICGRILQSVLGVFADGKKKCLTSQIRSAPDDFHRSLLRAFFDSEGSAYNYRSMIHVNQDDKIMLEDLSAIPQGLGIRANKVRYYINKNKRRYVFDITNKENFLKFHKEVGFLSSSKRLDPG